MPRQLTFTRSRSLLPEAGKNASPHNIPCPGNIPLVRDALELGLILGIRLQAQTGREDELADGGAEAAQEGVEGLVRFRMYVSVWLLFGVFVLMSGNCMHVFTHRG